MHSKASGRKTLVTKEKYTEPLDTCLRSVGGQAVYGGTFTGIRWGMEH